MGFAPLHPSYFLINEGSKRLRRMGGAERNPSESASTNMKILILNGYSPTEGATILLSIYDVL